MPRKDATALSTSNAQAQQDAVSEGIDAYELPKSLVTRLARSALPENAKLQKDMVLSLSNASTVFVNYLAATAHDIAAQKQHKSVSASDVLKALEQLDMGDMVPKLQHDLQAFRANQKGKKSTPNKDKSAQDTSTSAKSKPKIDLPIPDSFQGEKKAIITIPSRAVPLSVQNQTKISVLSEPVGEVEDSQEIVHDEEMMDVEESGMDEVEDEEPVDEDGEEDIGDDDELDDVAALEADEQKRDAKGVEERDHMEEDE